MIRPHRLLAFAAVFVAAVAGAQDRFSVSGDVDLRWVHVDGGGTSYLNDGYGIFRFDPDEDGLQFGRAYLAPNWRITDTVSMHAVMDAYGDGSRYPVDVSEFYLDVRPFPSTAVRWRARIGAFFMPVSLENRGTGWTDVYTITPSAINTWIGEEFRTVGAEIEARWLGASSGYLGDISLIGASYGWNDPAGVLLADRGFVMSDRPSTLFGGLGGTPYAFYHEIDRRPGYYAGITWRHHDRLEVRALRYDNRADPGSETASELYAWRTRFSSYGARLEPDAHWTFIAQYLDGDTAVGADSSGDDQFRMGFHAAFGLASYEWAQQRLSLRYDDFGTHQSSGFYEAPSDQSGHGWTYAWSYEFREHWQFVTEWLHMTSAYPARLSVGEPLQMTASQFQLAVRYRFHGGW